MFSNVQKSHQQVQDGDINYYVIEGLNAIHSEMIRLLKIIDDIATRNNIQYWIDAGSLIGVVRHNGFIPWDDDLDISMIKDDYIKLVSLLTDYCKDHDDVYLYFKSPQSYHTCNFFASRSCYTRAEKTAILIPVKVDLRPVNVIDSTKESIEENNKLRDIANYIIYNKRYGYYDGKKLNRKQRKAFFNYYNSKYGLLSSIKKDSLLVHPYFEYSNQFELKYDDIFPLKKHKFCDFEVSIPNNTEYLLGRLYGDYMTLPALIHRAPVACQFYKKSYPYFFIKRYINTIFGYNNKTLLHRIYYNLLLVCAMGIVPYIKAKFYE